SLVNFRNPKELPWKEYNIDVVVEATGKFVTKEEAGLHLKAGAKKVVITAPGKQVDNTIVIGVNENEYNEETEDVISNASCTTNCLAPVVKILDDQFKIVNSFMTTVQVITNGQKYLVNPHKDFRRTTGCIQSIIPTSTGGAKALGEFMLALQGRLLAMVLIVPAPNVSLVELVIDVKKQVTVE